MSVTTKVQLETYKIHHHHTILNIQDIIVNNVGTNENIFGNINEKVGNINEKVGNIQVYC